MPDREKTIENLRALSNIAAYNGDIQSMRTMDDAVVLLEASAPIPAADVVEEENVLKFYYVRSIDEYWIGQRVDNFYYAEYDSKTRQWVWTHSRYLPWGEHIISTTSLWKEHTYPSKPEEIPFADWLQGFIRKQSGSAERETKWEAKEGSDAEIH